MRKVELRMNEQNIGMHYNKETIDSEIIMEASKELMLG